MIYLVILAILIILCYIYDIQGYDNKKAIIWFRFILVVFVLLAGLRWRVGGDTVNYLYDYYYLTPDISHCTYEDFFRREPLFALLNITVKSLGCRFYVVQIIQAVIVNALIFKYIRRATDYPFAALIFYFVWRYVFLNFEEMRAGISVAISLFANDYMINGKWRKSLLLYLLASLFHYSSILLLFTSVLSFLKINKSIVVIIIISFFGGIVVQHYLGDFLFLFEVNDQVYGKMQNFTESEYDFSQTINWKGFVGAKFPYIFYSLFSFYYISKYPDKGKAQNILKYQPFVILGIVWVMISISIPISFRFTRFYEMYFILYFSYAFVELIRRNKRMGSLAFVRAFLLYFPCLFIMVHYYFDKPNIMKGESFTNYNRYIPYRSIFDRGENHEYEKIFDWYHKAKVNEY